MMKKILIGLLVAISTLAVMLPQAEAKRMGGGGSIGRQSQSVSRQAMPPSQNQAAAQRQAAPAATPQNAAPKPASPWRNILGGALLGLGLGALFSHFGMGGAMGSLLMVALLVMAGLFIFRMFRNKGQGGMQPAYANASHGYQADAMPKANTDTGVDTASTSTAANDMLFGVPAGFDTTGFLRHAKTYFIRLQAAWDKADVNDLREFTTPEMFAELKLELQERGASPNHTDVVSLNAELLGIENAGNDHVASVRFSGMIREEEHSAARPFTEVWNLAKPIAGQSGWVLAGIQQLA